MKFLTFLLALVALYALVQAKGDNVSQRKESPLRKALRRTTTAAPELTDEEIRDANSDLPTLIQERGAQEEQPVVQERVQDEEPVEVVREVVRRGPSKSGQRPQPTLIQERAQEEQPVEVPRKQEVVRKAPRKTIQRQQPVSIQEPVQQPIQQQQPVEVPGKQEVVRKAPRKTVQRQQPVLVQERAQEEQPVEVVREVVRRGPSKTAQRQQPVSIQEPVQQQQPVQQPIKRQYNVVRATQAPLVVRKTARPNVEIIRTVDVAPVEAVQPVEEPVLVVQEQVEQGQDETDEDNHGVQFQEPAPLKRFVSQPRKLEAPQQNKRRFNVLLRTAEGFNEKAGYSVHSRNALVN